VVLSRFLWDISKKTNDPLTNFFVIFLLIGWPIEVFFTGLSSRILLHYYITWIPYLSWLAGGAFAAIFAPGIRRLERVPAAYWISALLVLLLASNIPAIIRSAEIANRLIYNREGGVERDITIVDHVVARTEPGDTVLVWGNEVWINFFSRRASPTRYTYQYPLFMPGYTDREKVSAFLQELQSRPPALIVEPTVDSDEILPLSAEQREKQIEIYGIPEGMDAVFEFIDERYCVELVLRDITVYQLKNSLESSCE